MGKKIFSSYGTVIKSSHYNAPRLKLIDKAKKLLIGDEANGHYITVWASRQSGKSTTLIDTQVAIKKTTDEFLVAGISVEGWGNNKTAIDIMNLMLNDINKYLRGNLKKNIPTVKNENDFINFFTSEYLHKKLILVIDEFDCLEENIIAELAHVFRKIYLSMLNSDTPLNEKPLLHSLALIGIRSVLGIENSKGSPFNVQNSLRIPHLTYDEVNKMFHEYIKEHNQIIEQDVIDTLFYEVQGQPGLISWFGELLTATFNDEKNKPITMKNWQRTYVLLNGEPSAHLSNLISKVNETQEIRDFVITLFQTKNKIPFVFRNKLHNFLYLNGVIKPSEEINDKGETVLYIKFTCQFIHRQLFEYYADEFKSVRCRLFADPFLDIEAIISEKVLDIDAIINLYQEYVTTNGDVLFRDASRRKTDLNICEAVFHFNFYSYLTNFFENKPASVHPEFPTGNGKIDLVIKHSNTINAIELKSFVDFYEMKKAIKQAIEYAKSLGLKQITLMFFIEVKISDEKKIELEKSVYDKETNIEVRPRFLEV